MTHLGVRVSAYVDGQLPVSLTERVTAHLASCVICRDAVERERRMKRALIAMPEPAPGAEFMLTLVAMGGPQGPLGPRAGHVPGNPRPPLVMFESDVRRDPAFSLAQSGPAARVLRRRWGGALLGAATVVGAGVLSATLMPLITTGGAGPLIRPPAGSTAVTPGSPLVQQNVVRRFGGSRGWPSAGLTPSAASTSSPGLSGAVSTGPLTLGSWTWVTSGPPFPVAFR